MKNLKTGGIKMENKIKINWYDDITKTELQNIIKNLRWVKEGSKENDNLSDDGESNFAFNCYSGIQTFGTTDYKDHREDSLEKLKNLIMKNLQIFNLPSGFIIVAILIFPPYFMLLAILSGM